MKLPKCQVGYKTLIKVTRNHDILPYWIWKYTCDLSLTVLEESWRKLTGWGVWNNCSSSMTRPSSPSNFTAFCSQPKSEGRLSYINTPHLCYWCKFMSARASRIPVPINRTWWRRPSSVVTWSTTILENRGPARTSRGLPVIGVTAPSIRGWFFANSRVWSVKLREVITPEARSSSVMH